MRLCSTGQTSFNIMRGIMRTLAGWQRRRTRPAARGSSSHNPHYVWRPRVQPRSPCSAKLRSAVGSGAVLWPRSRRPPWRLRCRSAGASSCGSQLKEVVGLRPPLKRALCPPGVVWLRRLVPRKRPRVTRSRLASFRCPPWSVWSCKGKPRSGSGAAERRSVACGLSAARTRRPRAVAPPCRRRRPGGPPSRVAGNGLSGKRNDRFVAVVIW